MTARDTIFALSSGAPPAGIAVVRVSGPAALTVLSDLAGGLSEPRVATLRTIAEPGQPPIDRALVLSFPAPASATGEDVAEFHLHGGIAVVAALLAALERRVGLRAARPGELTRRAFDAGRLDLSQVEGLADLVAAETEAQRRAALAQAGGALRDAVARWRSILISLLADAEAHLDFADEGDVAVSGSDDPTAALEALTAEIAAELARARQSRLLRDGLTVVVTGPPNVGKSSLVNVLARRDVAIVSPIAGTTRDLIEVRLDLGGRLVTLVDTAGLHDDATGIEAEGMTRARARAATADLVLALYTSNTAPLEGVPVQTKIDLAAGRRDGLAVSSRTGEGVAELESWLTDWATTATGSELGILTSARHAAACREALDDIVAARHQRDPVLRAEALRLALRALGTITGAVGVEAVLDEIFARFCIGK